jgi:rubrerythrin
VKFNHIKLIRSLQLAYSGERAASFAYIGHARSLKDADEIEKIQEIERDEWSHRAEVLKIMNHYEIPVSTFLEIKYWLIGKFIGFSCLFFRSFYALFFCWKTGEWECL